MKDELEVLASWFTILVSAAYTFTVGYLDVLKVPINPSPVETFSFYLRAALLSDNWFQGLVRVFGPLVLFILFMKIFRAVRGLACCKEGPKRFLLDSIGLGLGILIICLWCNWSFEQGRDSLLKPTANTFFPEAYRNVKVKKNGVESTEEKLFRLAWIAEGKYFWLDCDPVQPQLIGVENDIEQFARRLGPDANKTICKPGR